MSYSSPKFRFLIAYLHDSLPGNYETHVYSESDLEIGYSGDNELVHCYEFEAQNEKIAKAIALAWAFENGFSKYDTVFSLEEVQKEHVNKYRKKSNHTKNRLNFI